MERREGENNCGISREEQDAYAIKSYSQSKAAFESGVLAKEIVPVTIPQKGLLLLVNGSIVEVANMSSLDSDTENAFVSQASLTLW